MENPSLVKLDEKLQINSALKSEKIWVEKTAFVEQMVVVTKMRGEIRLQQSIS